MFRRVIPANFKKANIVTRRTNGTEARFVHATNDQRNRNLMTAVALKSPLHQKIPHSFGSSMPKISSLTAFFSTSSFKATSDHSEIKINIYRKLKSIVTVSVEAAEKSKKPLLICIGELHSDYNSYLVQAILLNLLKNTNLKNFFLETTPNNMNRRYLGIKNDFEEIVSSQFEMELVPIEHPDVNTLFTFSDVMRNDHAKFEQSILIRERYMIDKLLSKSEGGIYVTGGKHLPAFIENEVLNRVYHLACIDISIYNDVLKKEFKNTSHSIGHLNKQRVEYLLTSTKINRFIEFNIPIQKYPKSAEEIFDEVLVIKNNVEKNNMTKSILSSMIK